MRGRRPSGRATPPLMGATSAAISRRVTRVQPETQSSWVTQVVAASASAQSSCGVAQ